MSGAMSLMMASGIGTYPTYEAAGTGAIEAPGAGGSFDIPYPSGIVSGSFLVAAIAFQDLTAVAGITVPAGWTQLGSTLANAAVTLRYYCIYKVADGTETGSLTVSVTSTNVDVATSGRMFRFANASAIDQVSQAFTEITGTAMALPTITPTYLNTLCVGLVLATGTTTYTPATYTEPVAEYNPSANIMIGICTLAVRLPGSSTFDNGTIGTTTINRGRFQFNLRK